MGLSLYHIHEAIELAINSAVDHETGEISDEGLEALGKLEMARDEKALNVAAYIQTVRVEAEAVKGQAKRLADRARILDNQAKRLLTYLMSNIPTDTKLKDERVTIGWRRSEAVEVLDATKVPAGLMRQADPEPNKAEIKKLLKAGDKVPGARLEQRTSLVVK